MTREEAISFLKKHPELARRLKDDTGVFADPEKIEPGVMQGMTPSVDPGLFPIGGGLPGAAESIGMQLAGTEAAKKAGQHGMGPVGQTVSGLVLPLLASVLGRRAMRFGRVREPLGEAPTAVEPETSTTPTPAPAAPRPSQRLALPAPPEPRPARPEAPETVAAPAMLGEEKPPRRPPPKSEPTLKERFPVGTKVMTVDGEREVTGHIGNLPTVKGVRDVERIYDPGEEASAIRQRETGEANRAWMKSRRQQALTQKKQTVEAKRSEARLTRNFQAGANSGAIRFSSEEQRLAYDAGAAASRATRQVGAQGRSLYKPLSPRFKELAQRLGVDPDDVRSIASDTYRDVRQQMEGLKDGETRSVTDNVVAKRILPKAFVTPPENAPEVAPERLQQFRLKSAQERLGDYETRLKESEEKLRGGDFIQRQTVNALRQAVDRERGEIAKLTGGAAPAPLGSIDEEAATLMRGAQAKGVPVLNQFLTEKPIVDPAISTAAQTEGGGSGPPSPPSTVEPEQPPLRGLPAIIKKLSDFALTEADPENKPLNIRRNEVEQSILSGQFPVAYDVFERAGITDEEFNGLLASGEIKPTGDGSRFVVNQKPPIGNVEDALKDLTPWRKPTNTPRAARPVIAGLRERFGQQALAMEQEVQKQAGQRYLREDTIKARARELMAARLSPETRVTTSAGEGEVVAREGTRRIRIKLDDGREITLPVFRVLLP